MAIIKNEIQLGVKAKDKITGFEGIVTAKIEYLTGCAQYCLTPECKEGKVQPNEYFDGARLQKTGEGVSPDSVSEEDAPGGINRDCPN